jgi:hypothetical protein
VSVESSFCQENFLLIFVGQQPCSSGPLIGSTQTPLVRCNLR